MSADNSPSKLLVLSAPSGAGKSTLAQLVLDHFQNVRLSISHTTRAPRGDEKNGEHYHFVSTEEFEKMVHAKQFLEYALVFGKYYYGTHKKTVEDMLQNGSHVLFDIDVQGAASLKKIFGNRCLTVFILPPSMQELESRLKKRKTDSAESIELRIQTAREEIKQANLFDFKVTNHDLDESFLELKKILEKNGIFSSTKTPYPKKAPSK